MCYHSHYGHNGRFGRSGCLGSIDRSDHTGCPGPNDRIRVSHPVPLGFPGHDSRTVYARYSGSE